MMEAHETVCYRIDGKLSIEKLYTHNVIIA